MNKQTLKSSETSFYGDIKQITTAQEAKNKYNLLLISHGVNALNTIENTMRVKGYGGSKIYWTPNLEQVQKAVNTGEISGIVSLNADEIEEKNLTLQEPSPENLITRKSVFLENIKTELDPETKMPPILLQDSEVQRGQLESFLEAYMPLN